LKLKTEKLLSNFGFNFNLRRCTMEPPAQRDQPMPAAVDLDDNDGGGGGRGNPKP